MMSEDLLPLSRCLKQLDSEKITERKKQVEILENLLKKPEIIKVLDQNTDRKKKKAEGKLTWDVVFEAVQSYIAVEAERLKKRGDSIEKLSATSLNNWNKEKQACSSLYKTVVKAANQRKPRLSTGHLLNHIVKVLDDDFMCSMLGLDSTNILLKDILTTSQTFGDIELPMFNSLIQKFMKLFHAPPAGWDRCLLTQTICQLTDKALLLYSLKPQILFNFFLSSVKSARSEKATNFYESLLCAFLTICRTSALDCRYQICYLGEETITQMIHLWNNKSSELMREYLLEFFRLQIAVHHPCGKKTPEGGASAYNWDTWNDMLRKLYNLIHNELKVLSARSKYSSSKDFTCKPKFIAFAIEVCYHIFSLPESHIMATQYYTCADASSSSKKLKIEIGIQNIISTIQQNSLSQEVIPLLQLLSALLSKYPEIMDIEELTNLLEMLFQIHLSCKQLEIKSWLIRCCHSIVTAYCHWKDKEIIEGKMLMDNFLKICHHHWEIVIKTVAVNYCHDESHQLLQLMLIKKLVTPKTEFFRLYASGSGNMPSNESITTLLTFLQNYAIPCYQPSFYKETYAKEIQSLWFQYQVLEWLFPTNDDLVTNINSSIPSCIKSQKLSIIPLLAELIIGISVQNSRIFRNLSKRQQITRTSVSDWKWIEELENQYLQISFDELAFEHLCDEGEETVNKSELKESECITQNLAKMNISGKVNVLLWDSVQKRIVKMSGESLELVAQQQPIENNILLVEAYLIIKILQMMLKYNILSGDKVKKSGLTNLAKNLIEAASNKILTRFEETKNTAEILPSLLTLESIFSNDLYKDMDQFQRKEFATWIISLFPMKLSAFCFTIISSKGSYFNTSASNRSLQQGDADLDDEFDQDMGSLRLHEEISDKDDIMDTGQFSKEQHNYIEIQLCCVSLLCHWYRHATLLNNETDNMLSPQEILKKLLATFHSDSHKEIGYGTVQMAVKAFKCLLKGNYSFEVVELLAIINMLRHILNKYHKEQEISISCLDILSLLVPYILCEDYSDEMRKIRECAIHLVQVFWKQQLQDKCNSNVAFALARTMSRILEHDPQEKLMLWRSDNKEQKNQPLLADFLKFLQNRNHKIRKFSAISIQHLFKKEKKHLPLQHQSSAFEKIYVAGISSLQSVQNLKPLVKVDEKNNRTASLVLSLSYVILSSPYCEKLALFALCQSTKEKEVLVGTVVKALTQVSVLLKYASIKEFINVHLPFLINEWLKHKYPLEEFPFQFLQCETLEEFYKEYYAMMVPLLFHRHDLTMVQNLCEVIKHDWLEILKECLPQLLGKILPWFASAASSNTSSKPEQQQAFKSHCLLEEILSKNDVENTLEEKLEDVVICLLNSIKDTAELEDNDNRRGAPIHTDNPSSFSVEMIQLTFHYLMQNCCTDKNKSLAGLLSRKQDGIQNILLFLHANLAKAHRQRERKRGLLMYNFFVELLLPELSSGLGGNSPFVIRDIITVMMHCLEEKSFDEKIEENQPLCIEIIHKICQNSLPSYAKTIRQHLARLVNLLTVYIEQAKNAGGKALALLNYLLVDNAEHLEETVAHLVPLPERPEYRTIHHIHKNLRYAANLSLEEEMSRFVHTHGSGQSICKLEGLQHFLLQLQQKKSELKMMIHSLQETRLFSEDINSSIIHKVVSALIQISTHLDPKIQEVAAKCLGEIGPVDLSTIALQPSEYFQQEGEILNTFAGIKPQYKCYYFILNLLNDLLQDNRIDVISSSASVLKNIFATKTGKDFIAFYKKQKFGDLHLYLQPFQTGKKAPLHTETSSSKCTDTVNKSSLWCPDSCTHEEWIIKLVNSLINDSVNNDEILRQLGPICSIEVSFSEKILPYLVHTILLRKDVAITDAISHQVSTFFSKHSIQNHSSSSQQLSANGTTKPSIYLCKASIKTMLSVVHKLRCNQRDGDPNATSWDNHFWLNINYLHVAQAALFCYAPFTSLLYTEIWCDAEMRQKKTGQGSCFESDDSSSSQGSPLLIAAIHSESTNLNLFNKILNESYRLIGVVDAEYGCQSLDINNECNQVNYYARQKQWNRLLSFEDLHLSNSNERLNIGVLKAMQKCGLYNILQDYVNSAILDVIEPPSQLLECQHECAWRMSQWNLPCVDSLEVGFHQAVYQSLKCLNSKDQEGFAENLNAGWISVLHDLGSLSLESIRNVYTTLGNSQLLCSVQKYSQTVWGESHLSSVVQQWKNQHMLPSSDFEFVEPVLWIQCVLLKLNNDNFRQGYSSDILIDFLCTYAANAIEELEIKRAQKAVYLLETLNKECEKSFHWKIEDAKIHWIRGEHLIANQKLKYVLKLLEKSTGLEMAELYAKALILNGEWLSEKHLASSSMIMKDYFEKAVEVLEPDPSSQRESITSPIMWDASLSVARYADAEYQRIVNYIKSPAYQSKLEIAKHCHQEYLKMDQRKKDRTSSLCEDEIRVLKAAERQVKNDKEEAAALEKEKYHFLQKAVENYLRCLRGTDKHDLRVFRLIALWFQNSENENINKLIKDNILHIQTYKFLPLMYQLAARMAASQLSGFHSILFQLIKKITLDHPYHSLPIILALKNAEADTAYTSSSSNNSPARKEERVEAAKYLISDLKKSKLQEIVTEMEVVCSAYIQLACLTSKNRSGEIEIPFGQQLLKIKEFDAVPVLTSKVRVSPNCCYENVPGIKSFLTKYELIGGLNAPKVITCMASDGKRHKQLVKGKDDMRQDAVMQQVFNLVNNLLESNKETKKRKLNIRTYKVIPLSRRSGLLEWCEGTQTLGQYLAPLDKSGRRGAHQRYFPGDWPPHKCLIAMQEMANKTFDIKKEVYKTICHNFHPVFRYFFLEHFSEPSSWFERRLTYTQSVATSSIVGYIVGLGDRHVNNILIDMYTAQIVHIDFGIAFEKGKLLPTPETVPFRLTRDIVDGMGICGTEGVFKRCAEKTMEVMRDSKEVLLTILEVFLHDPLYEWTLSPKLAATHQRLHSEDPYSDENASVTSVSSDDSDYPKFQGEVNKEAERALIRLQQKLQGIENGVTMNVSEQVNLLIQQARDPDNLCRLFRGWQPYL